MKGAHGMKKIIALLLAALMLLTVFTACQSKDSADTTKDTNTAADTASSGQSGKDTLTVAVSTEPVSMNITETNLVYDLLVWDMVYSRLIRDTGCSDYEPDLAESYEMVSDTQWKFTLRGNAAFSDGTPVTAADVAASLDALHESAVVGAKVAWLASTEVVDDQTILINTDGPAATILLDLSNIGFIVPAKLLQEGYNFNEAPVGSGPYTLKEWVRGDHLTFEANENYYLADQIPAIKTVVYRIIPEGISRTIALQNGEIDYLYDPQASDISTLQATDGINVYVADCASPFYMTFNMNKPILQDINIRKAIAMAINRENASLAGTGGLSKPLFSRFPMGLLGSSDAKAVSYDPETAKQLIADSGYTADQLTFKIVTKEEPFRVALESVQADMQEIGVTLKIEMVDNATYSSLAESDDFDMAVGKTNNVNLLGTINSSYQSSAAYNQSHLKDNFIDEQLVTASKTVDDAERAKILARLVDYVDENCFGCGIYQLTNVRAYSADLEGIAVNMNGYDRFNLLRWK